MKNNTPVNLSFSEWICWQWGLRQTYKSRALVPKTFHYPSGETVLGLTYLSKMYILLLLILCNKHVPVFPRPCHIDSHPQIRWYVSQWSRVRRAISITLRQASQQNPPEQFVGKSRAVGEQLLWQPWEGRASGCICKERAKEVPHRYYGADYKGMMMSENFVVWSLEADMELRSRVSLRMLQSTACEREASTLGV